MTNYISKILSKKSAEELREIYDGNLWLLDKNEDEMLITEDQVELMKALNKMIAEAIYIRDEKELNKIK